MSRRSDFLPDGYVLLRDEGNGWISWRWRREYATGKILFSEVQPTAAEAARSARKHAEANHPDGR